jgi:hypothetical protein
MALGFISEESPEHIRTAIEIPYHPWFFRFLFGCRVWGSVARTGSRVRWSAIIDFYPSGQWCLCNHEEICMNLCLCLTRTLSCLCWLITDIALGVIDVASAAHRSKRTKYSAWDTTASGRRGLVQGLSLWDNRLCLADWQCWIASSHPFHVIH